MSFADRTQGDARLRRWLKRHSHYPQTRVFAMGWRHLDGPVDCNPHDMLGQDIWIGFRDDRYICGANVKHVLTGITKSTQAWALAVGRTSSPTDITEWFWREYARLGICLVFENAHAWVKINRNARKCSRCGLHQYRSVRTERRYERVDIWGAP